jgi:hypothetical protein
VESVISYSRPLTRAENGLARKCGTCFPMFLKLVGGIKTTFGAMPGSAAMKKRHRLITSYCHHSMDFRFRPGLDRAGEKFFGNHHGVEIGGSNR